MENTNTETYYAARRIGKKWKVSAILKMPKTSCLARAERMLHALGDSNWAAVLHSSQKNQKNILPIETDIPELNYDARKYFEYEYAQQLDDAGRDFIAEWAAGEGINLLSRAA